MKNLVYLLHSTLKEHKHFGERVRTHVGTTNYLYRELQVHNHEWHPKFRDRRRDPSYYARGKLGWRYTAVVSGFPSEESAQSFRDMFYKPLPLKNDVSLLRPVKELQRKEVDGVAYRLRQLSLITRKQFETLPDVPRLTIHVDKDQFEKYCEQVHFAPNCRVVPSLDVTALDRQWHDVTDMDDDRNYRQLRHKMVEEMRRDKIVSLSDELQIPVDEVQDILHRSRLQARDALLNKSAKVSKKVAKFVHITPPRPVHASFANARAGKEVSRQ